MTRRKLPPLKPMIAFPKDPSACWDWQGLIDENGYPRKVMDGNKTTAQRWMWTVMHGPVPAELLILTTCGNRICVNPYHLRATPAADASRGGMSAVLTPADVREVKRAKATKGPNTATFLAERFGCSTAAIRNIWRGNTWGKPGARKAKAA